MHEHHSHDADTSGGEAAIDPVCGMTVMLDAGKPSFDYKGTTYHFCCDGCRQKFAADPEPYLAKQAAAKAEVETAIDPVCGMTVKLNAGKPSFDYKGTTYHFCCDGCRQKFAADPEQYLAKAAEGHALHHHHGPAVSDKPMPKGTLYTCPMHPEIVQEGPGSCPICGMGLEPMVPTGDEGPNPELVDMTRRLIVATPLAAALLVVEMSRHLFGLDLLPFLSARGQQYLQLVLALPVVLWCGLPFFERGVASIRTGNLNMFTLIAVGTGAAFLYSVVGVFLPGLFPSEMLSAAGHRPALFRGLGGDHGAGAARPGAGVAGARAHGRGHPRPARPVAEDGAAGGEGRPD